MGDMSAPAQPSGNVNFDDVRAMLREITQQMKETDRRMKETDRKISKLCSRLGEVIEHIMSPKLHKKFEEHGLYINHTSRNHELVDKNRERLTEVDVLLENDECVLAVEVKTHLTTKDVRNHVKRMGILRRVADDCQDRRKYLGAVAGAVIDQEVSAYALKNGFYVISPSGETVDITAPADSALRVW
jgi:predicted transcriptional regulator